MGQTQLEALYNQIKTLFVEFEENHLKHAVKGNKAASSRARKALGQLRSLVTPYRQESIAANKTEETV